MSPDVVISRDAPHVIFLEVPLTLCPLLKIEEKTMQKAELLELRDDYSDEIPDTVVHGNLTYKVQRNWWTGVVGVLANLASEGVLQGELIREVDRFIKRYSSQEFHRQPLTTQQDLNNANAMLNKVLEALDQ